MAPLYIPLPTFQMFKTAAKDQSSVMRWCVVEWAVLRYSSLVQTISIE